MYTKKAELLYDAGKYCGELITAVNEAVGLFRNANEQEALQSMAEIIDAIQWMVEAITAVTDILVNPIDVSSLNEFLNEMANAIENLDFVLLADLLEYEICPILSSWETILDNSLTERQVQ